MRGKDDIWSLHLLDINDKEHLDTTFALLWNIPHVIEHLSTDPSPAPADSPTASPSQGHSWVPSSLPSLDPTERPSRKPSSAPSVVPTSSPTDHPTGLPLEHPRRVLTATPSSLTKGTDIPVIDRMKHSRIMSTLAHQNLPKLYLKLNKF